VNNLPILMVSRCLVFDQTVLFFGDLPGQSTDNKPDKHLSIFAANCTTKGAVHILCNAWQGGRGLTIC